MRRGRRSLLGTVFTGKFFFEEFKILTSFSNNLLLLHFDRFDLTADHFSLRFGSLNLTENSSSSAKFAAVQRVVLHPAFTSATFNADLALLILSERVHLDNDSVGLIEISKEENFPLENDLITVQGWGQTSSGTTSEWLMRARLRVNNFEQCRRIWATDGQPVLAGSMFCASGEQQSSCKV